MYPKLAALPLPERPKDQPVDKSIAKADKVDPALVQRFGAPKRGQAVIWDDANRPVRVDEEIPE